MSVSFIDGGNRSTRRKPPTCRNSLTNSITLFCTTLTTEPWCIEIEPIGFRKCSHKRDIFYNIIRPTLINDIYVKYCLWSEVNGLSSLDYIMWTVLVGKLNLYHGRNYIETNASYRNWRLFFIQRFYFKIIKSKSRHDSRHTSFFSHVSILAGSCPDAMYIVI